MENATMVAPLANLEVSPALFFRSKRSEIRYTTPPRIAVASPTRNEPSAKVMPRASAIRDLPSKPG